MPNQTEVAVVLVGAVLSLTGMCLIGCAGKKVPPAEAGAGPSGPAYSRFHSGPPLTEKECAEFGKEYEKAINSGDVEACFNLMDNDAIHESMSEAQRRSFVKRLREEAEKKVSSRAPLQGMGLENGRYKFLRAHTEHGQNRVLFRGITEDGTLHYHDLVLARRTGGKVKAVDIYLFRLGEMESESLLPNPPPDLIKAEGGSGFWHF